jgi:hypothetical protein
MHRADGDRRAGQIIKAMRELEPTFLRASVKRGVRGSLVRERLFNRGA